jgi:hypothetical protein
MFLQNDVKIAIIESDNGAFQLENFSDGQSTLNFNRTTLNLGKHSDPVHQIHCDGRGTFFIF